MMSFVFWGLVLVFTKLCDGSCLSGFSKVISSGKFQRYYLLSPKPNPEIQFLRRTVERKAFLIMMVIEIAEIYWTLKAYGLRKDDTTGIKLPKLD